MDVLVFIGTRPEAIKLAPVVLALRHSRILRPVVCSTGQHREMLASALADFGLVPDVELGLMTPGQTLGELSGRLFLGMEKALRDLAPACILIQGDTTTAMIGAVVGFFRRIPVGHVEAGLRSGDMNAPFPEEFNRCVAALAAAWHFAPTDGAAARLLSEGIAPKQVFVTGNTVVDALYAMRDVVRREPPHLPETAERIVRCGIPYVLITSHRRENFGQGMDKICTAVARLAARHPKCAFIYPVHLNPRVRDVVSARLAGLSNVALIPPCGYKAFLHLLDNCLFILSDSGGVQEEAPSFGKKVLVMREVTERPEGVAIGFCHLVGTDVENILQAAEEVFADPTPPQASNPYGDGRAVERITAILEKVLS